MQEMIEVNLKGWKCQRCGHIWIPRIKKETQPTICPKCKSPYWNKQKKKK